MKSTGRVALQVELECFLPCKKSQVCHALNEWVIGQDSKGPPPLCSGSAGLTVNASL